VKHTNKQIIFDIEGEHFKVKVTGDIDLEEVYTILLSAMMYLEEMAQGISVHPSNELH
jgi:hypothetical protein